MQKLDIALDLVGGIIYALLNAAWVNSAGVESDMSVCSSQEAVMTASKRAGFWICVLSIFVCAAWSVSAGQDGGPPHDDIVQAQIVLTVSESKRLIARSVARMPIVKKALKEGMVIIAKGTTNTYVAEEILGEKIAHGPYILGKTFPAKGGKPFKPAEGLSEVIIVKGEHKKRLTVEEAVKRLQPGDIVIKGANALNYENKTAGVIIGSSSCGTTGKIMPYVVARKAHLVIPVGLEKQVSGSVVDIANKMRQPVESLNDIPSMFLLTGHIITEIEALQSFADVSVFQAAAGGIGGAEGAVRIICRGSRSQVDKILRLAEEIQGEPPFVE